MRVLFCTTIRSGRHSAPIIEMAGTSLSLAMTKWKPPRSFAPVTLGCAQSLDSTLFFRGISFCQNGASPTLEPDSRQQYAMGIKSYKPGRHGAPIIEMAGTSRP